MLHLFNQGSFIVTVLIAMGGVAAILFRGGASPARGLMFFGVLAALVSFQLIMRSGPGAGAEEAERLIGAGSPVLLQFYSDY